MPSNALFDDLMSSLSANNDLAATFEERDQEAIEYKKNKLRLQLLPTIRMKHDALVEWLSEPNSPLRFHPETTLEMLQVPQSMDGILAGLEQFQRIFPEVETDV